MQNRRPSNDWSGDSGGKGDRRRKRPEIIYVVRPSEDDDGSGENRRRERPQDHHRPRPVSGNLIKDNFIDKFSHQELQLK